MSQNERATNVQSPQHEAHTPAPPQPHPALKRLDRLVGVWHVVDPSGAEGTGGRLRMNGSKVASICCTM